MRMQTIFEAMGGTYRQEGDYLLPNIEEPESPQIGIWGQRRLQYIRTNKNVLYITMLMSGKLKDHLEEVDQTAEEMFKRLVKQIHAIRGHSLTDNAYYGRNTKISDFKVKNYSSSWVFYLLE